MHPLLHPLSQVESLSLTLPQRAAERIRLAIPRAQQLPPFGIKLKVTGDMFHFTDEQEKGRHKQQVDLKFFILYGRSEVDLSENVDAIRHHRKLHRERFFTGKADVKTPQIIRNLLSFWVLLRQSPQQRFQLIDDNRSSQFRQLHRIASSFWLSIS
nr:hypothetical protein [Alkalicoccus chagannorensis]